MTLPASLSAEGVLQKNVLRRLRQTLRQQLLLKALRYQRRPLRIPRSQRRHLEVPSCQRHQLKAFKYQKLQLLPYREVGGNGRPG